MDGFVLNSLTAVAFLMMMRRRKTIFIHAMICTSFLWYLGRSLSSATSSARTIPPLRRNSAYVLEYTRIVSYMTAYMPYIIRVWFILPYWMPGADEGRYFVRETKTYSFPPPGRCAHHTFYICFDADVYTTMHIMTIISCRRQRSIAPAFYRI